MLKYKVYFWIKDSTMDTEEQKEITKKATEILKIIFGTDNNYINELLEEYLKYHEGKTFKTDLIDINNDELNNLEDTLLEKLQQIYDTKEIEISFYEPVISLPSIN